jgi:hypothetical protein
MIITVYKDCGIINLFCLEDMHNVIINEKKLKRKYKVRRFYINNLHSENFKTFNF